MKRLQLDMRTVCVDHFPRPVGLYKHVSPSPTAVPCPSIRVNPSEPKLYSRNCSSTRQRNDVNALPIPLFPPPRLPIMARSLRLPLLEST